MKAIEEAYVDLRICTGTSEQEIAKNSLQTYSIEQHLRIFAKV